MISRISISKFRISILVLFACLGTMVAQAQQGKGSTMQKCPMQIKITKIEPSSRADTLKVNFKLMQDGKKRFHPEILKQDSKASFVVNELGTSNRYQPKVDTLMDIRNKKSMADNLVILFLIDRSITVKDNVLMELHAVMTKLSKEFPDTRKYVSFMENGTVTKTDRLDSVSWNERITSGFSVKSGEKNLYRSIMSKLQELSGEDQSYYKGTEISDFKNDGCEHILFVFTDGIVKNAKGEYYGGQGDYQTMRIDYYDWEDRIQNREIENIPVHCVYLGDTEGGIDPMLENELMALCSTGNADDEKGKFYKDFSLDSLEQIIMGSLDSLSADYRLVLLNEDGKLYDGSRLTMQIWINGKDSVSIACGEKAYALGSPQLPIRVSSRNVSPWQVILIGLILGLLLLAVTYVVLQYLVPAIRYKRFLKKYVVPYSSAKSGLEEQYCYYCKDKFNEGDMVVTKCKHVVHKECWDENRNRCPEYGRHKCKTGIHYYNQERKSDPKNTTHFLQWILAGFVAGLLSWLCFRLLNSLNLFAPVMQSIAEKLYPFSAGIDDYEKMSIVARIVTKTSQWLQAGVSLGFFIVLAFSYVLEFRKIDGKVLGQLLLKSCVGAILGWCAFILGSLLVVLGGMEDSCWWIDWIPWMFFALAVSLVLWYKTEVKLKSALLGGMVSVLFSFIVMFVFTGTVTSMFSYMIYAAGLGMAIAVVHYASEKYFLRIDGSVKERDIAIYKWMSVTGGFNKVSIGKSVSCVLQMNWDPTPDISDRAVELYLENDFPYCKVMDAGVTQQGRTLPVGTVIRLTHGSEFTIGKTRFTYIEKDS